MDPAKPDFWALRLEPTDQPTLQARDIDVETAIANALGNRTDLLQQRKLLENTDINLRFLNNQTLPDVSLNASYRTVGLGGTILEFEPTIPPREIGRTERSLASVLRDVFGNEFRTWSLSVSIGYPIGTSQAEASLARARLQRNQTTTDLRNMELQITAAVRQAARNVTTNLQRVQSTQIARQLSERKLDAEERKFGVGLSDTFRVFQSQRDLASARNAELRAIIEYNKALIDFEAVQLAPLGGG
jgi:outer membrane protein TolC